MSMEQSGKRKGIHITVNDSKDTKKLVTQNFSKRHREVYAELLFSFLKEFYLTFVADFEKIKGEVFLFPFKLLQAGRSVICCMAGTEGPSIM